MVEILSAIAVLLFLALGAFAQSGDFGRLALGLGVGPILVPSVSADVSGGISGSGTLQFNNSGFVGLIVDYYLSDRFRLDGEGGWSLYDSSNLIGTFAGSKGAVASPIPLNGDMHTWLGLVNIAYRIRNRRARLSPYLGVGGGVAALEWLVDSRPGGTTFLRLQGGSASFAPDAIAGVEYRITGKFSLGGRYNFVRVANEIPTIGGGITLHHSAPNLHFLQLVGTYRF